MRKNKIEAKHTKSHGKCDLEDRSHVPEDVFGRTTVFTELQWACEEVKRSRVPKNKLAEEIANLPKLNRQVRLLKYLESAFKNTLEAIRQLDVCFDLDDTVHKGNKRVFIPLRPLCRILGISLPEPSVGDNVEWDFARDQLNIAPTDIMCFGEYHVADNAVPHLIVRAGRLHPEIARQLSDWFRAFALERNRSTWDSTPVAEF